jgi:hypothetical protein
VKERVDEVRTECKKIECGDCSMPSVELSCFTAF